MTSLHAKASVETVSYPQAVLRLTAIWAMVESGFGGVLHAFKLPLTGLVIGGTAVLLITLIAHFAKRPSEILRATLLVLIIKALVSPHAPVGAYIAVGFQGVLGWLMYTVGRPGTLTSLPFALVAMLESALQKLLMLVLFFGKPLVASVDKWGAWVIERYFPSVEAADFSLTWFLVGGYVAVYVLGGVVIGWFASGLPARVDQQLSKLELEHAKGVEEWLTSEEMIPRQARRAKKFRRLGWWLVLTLALAASIYVGQTTGSRWQSAAVYFVRTLSIVGLWYLLVGPLLAKLLRRWLLKKSEHYAQAIDEVMELIPQMRGLAKAEFGRLSAKHTGFKLYRTWILRVLVMSLVR